jgi:hypothetical protein
MNRGKAIAVLALPTLAVLFIVYFILAIGFSAETMSRMGYPLDASNHKP